MKISSMSLIAISRVVIEKNLVWGLLLREKKNCSKMINGLIGL